MAQQHEVRRSVARTWSGMPLAAALVGAAAACLGNAATANAHVHAHAITTAALSASSAPAASAAPVEGAPAPVPQAGTTTAPVPPHVEAAPVQAAGGGYCYAGPHPVDTRVAAGAAWDDTPGRHTHTYAPIDLRLFTFHEGCYYFVGDPSDFGYRGQTYAYYGAHPVMVDHGGGWCFMIGGHSHWWRPWSPHFIVAGPWYYWHGPYDPFFWHYWPYYAVYYRHHYPYYYRGGRFARGGWNGDGTGTGGRARAVAPPIGAVPAPPASATASSTQWGAPGTRSSWGSAAAGNGAAPAPTPWRSGWSGAVSPRDGSWGARPSVTAPGNRSSFGRDNWSGFRSGPSAAPAPAPSFRSAPAGDRGSFFRGAGSGGGSAPSTAPLRRGGWGR